MPLTDSLISFARFLSIFRVFVVGLMVMMMMLGIGLFGILYPALFLGLALVYMIFSLVIIFSRRQDTLQANEQLAHSLLDITFLTTLAGLSGGMQSGVAILVLIIIGLGAGLCSKTGWKLLVLWAIVSTLLNEMFRLEGLTGNLLLQSNYANPAKNLQWFGVAFSLPEAYIPSFFMSIAFIVSGAVANRLGYRLRNIDQEKSRHQMRLDLQLRINAVMMKSMEEGIILVDHKAQIHQINRRAQELLSLDSQHLAPNLRDLSLRLHDHFFQWRHHQGLGKCEFRINQNRSLYNARFLAVPPDQSMSIIFVQDQEQVRLQAQKLKMGALGLLTANIAHEIRNPLSAIHQSAEYLQEEIHLLEKSPQQRLPSMFESVTEKVSGDGINASVDYATWSSLINIILEHSERIDRIIHDVTELGRRDRVNKTLWHLHDKVRDVIADFVVLHRSEGFDEHLIKLDIPSNIKMEFDENHFRQILTNLLNNAWHYCKRERGSIRIHARWDSGGQEVKMFLVDDGPGIPPSAVANIFEPFFTTRPSGSGLGLYICRELSEANDGQLVLLDNAPGAYFCLSALGANS